MSDTPQNPAAFPINQEWLPEFEHLNGMTLMDYFAAKAMQGIAKQFTSAQDDQCAAQAYKLAFAMLKEREKYIK